MGMSRKTYTLQGLYFYLSGVHAKKDVLEKARRDYEESLLNDQAKALFTEIFETGVLS